MNSNTNASAANASGASATGVTAIDFRTLPDFIPSMCIPRVYPNISEGRIRKIFDELNIGVIDRVDIVSKTTEKGERFNRVFIHIGRSRLISLPPKVLLLIITIIRRRQQFSLILLMMRKRKRKREESLR